MHVKYHELHTYTRLQSLLANKLLNCIDADYRLLDYACEKKKEKKK